VFTVVGMLHPSKQQAKVIKAFAKLNRKYPNLKLLIAGDGQYLYTLYLKTLILYLGLRNKVELLGYVSDLKKIYEATDVVITASLHEGLGRSTIEGMAYKKPIVGVKSGATPELVEHNKRGLLFSDESEEELLIAMEDMINNPQKRDEMGEKGRAFVSTNFMIDDYANKMHEIITEIKKK